MITFIGILFFVGIPCALLAFDALRRLLSLLPGRSKASPSNFRKTALIGCGEIAVTLVLIVGMFIVFLTQPLFGPSFLTTHSEVQKYLELNRPSIEMTDFDMAESPSQANAYLIRAGSSSQMVNLLVVFEPKTKKIVEIKEQP